MNEKDYRDMGIYKQTMGSVDEKERKQLTFYEKNVKKEKTVKQKGESKSAIWWMIMIFCLVYGFEVIYTAMITAP